MADPSTDRDDFLVRVCREAADRVAADRAVISTAALAEQARAVPAPPGFANALARPGLSVIAEVKRASPSRGHLADIPDPARLARQYADGGARAISVLTEPVHFHGSLEDLQQVAAAVEVPVLRKDFVVDAHQVWEARAAGAAAVLLIVAALDDDTLAALVGVAEEADLDVLVETHTAAEVRRAVAAHERSGTVRSLVVGINARDLATLEVDRAVVRRVRDEADLPEGTLLVAESGVRGPADARAYAAVGADAILVGEHVATAPDPQAAVAELCLPGPTTPPSTPPSTTPHSTIPSQTPTRQEPT